MPCTIDATPGGTTSNSYATIVQADAYHDTLPFADDWLNAEESSKCRALIQATRLLDTWFDWYGAVSDLNQRLLWPRMGVIKPGISEGTFGTATLNIWQQPFAVLLDQHTIPDRIVEATAEYARQLLVSDRTADSDTETQGLKSVKAGPIELVFSGAVEAKPVPDSVKSMLSGTYGVPRSRGGGAVTLLRG